MSKHKLADIIYGALKDDERNIEVNVNASDAIFIEVSAEADYHEVSQGELSEGECGCKSYRVTGKWYQVRVYIPE